MYYARIAIMAKPAKTYPLDRLFRALADPTRLRLLNLMAGGGEVCVCYFVEILKTSQPKISRHLAYLRGAGIVAARRDGKWMHYRLVMPASSAAAEILQQTLKALAAEKNLQADRQHLTLACCQPEKFVSLMGAPPPSHLEKQMIGGR
jgi:ArsR family transcriptional regulator, arsenate/arsenite/antimonite-responsive transcriptional repressor